MDTTHTNDHVTMMQIPVSGIPKGFKIVEIRQAKIGDTVVADLPCGFMVWREGCDKPGTRMILQKLYDPNVGVPNGWTVHHDSVDWCASKNPYCDDGLIFGLQHLDGFIPPPDGISAKVER